MGTFITLSFFERMEREGEREREIISFSSE